MGESGLDDAQMTPVVHEASRTLRQLVSRLMHSDVANFSAALAKNLVHAIRVACEQRPGLQLHLQK